MIRAVNRLLSICLYVYMRVGIYVIGITVMIDWVRTEWRQRDSCVEMGKEGVERKVMVGS